MASAWKYYKRLMRSSKRARTPRREQWPDSWLLARSGDRMQLGLRSLYILPTRFGWLWLASCAVLYQMGTSSGSSGPLLLAYGGLSIFLLSPFLTQLNLQGLTLCCSEPKPGFAGTSILYPIDVLSDVARQQLCFSWSGHSCQWSGDIQPGRSQLAVPWEPSQRGLQTPGRLRIESRAPLGLFKCWTLWHPSAAQLIYPAPIRGSTVRLAIKQQQLNNSDNPSQGDAGVQTWEGLSPHRVEEGLSRLDWKQLARTGNRLSKRFSDPQPRADLIAPDPSMPWEQALQHVCDQCIRMASRGTAFGVSVGKSLIEPASGQRQLRACLEALALAPRQ